eukprot:TRINITY_DN1474_c0_g1_i1.p1 TRINITY_DN1474_c0_g1~~TRINITY_DN1474_c0_g1_i1.p1  ORF type:complete len:332 (-),score=55.67 TRINITY_DN1474_c0_g1_i1:157-1011(-)
MRWPLVPSEDWRKLSNQEVQAQRHQQQILNYSKKYGLGEIFPNLGCEVSLNLQFSDMYWHSVFCGNHIPVGQVQKQPEVRIAGDATTNTPEDSHFTLLMLSPDYPFRTNPEDGHLLHWMICNIPLGGEGSYDTVVDYLAPLPTEYAGHFRIIFALFKQCGGKVQLPAPVSSGHYPLERRRNFFLHSRRPHNCSEDKNMAHIQQHLSPVPSAVPFFHTSYDIEVSEYYQKHALKEPIFTPDNIVRTMLFHEKYSERKQFVTFHRPAAWKAIWPSKLPRLRRFLPR